MAAPIGYGLWLWFKSSPMAQGAAALGAVLAAFWAFMTLRDRRIRRQAKAEAKREVIEQIEEQTDEAVQRVEDERARVRDLNDAERMRLARESPYNRRRM